MFAIVICFMLLKLCCVLCALMVEVMSVVVNVMLYIMSVISLLSARTLVKLCTS